MWYFLKTEVLKEFNFDHSLKDFFERGIYGLVRENIQNSLDAKDTSQNNPVIVNIEKGFLKINELPYIEEIKDHINSLKGYNEYAEETIKNMKETLQKYDTEVQEVPYISFEDLNTVGLSGVPTKNKLDVSGSWSSYAYYRGSHHRTEMESKHFISGGSHGIGKISSNAASALHLMYFSNCDESNNMNISGNISLIDHSIDNQKFSGAGIFTEHVIDNGELKFYPENNFYNYPFKKETRGLKIIIPFLMPKYSDTKEIVKAVCDNFFVSILDGELEVNVDLLEINKNSIKDIVKNTKYYPNQSREKMRDEHTPVYLETYLNFKQDEIFEVDDGFGNKYKFNIYYQNNENIKSGRFAIVRKIGMTIENRKVRGFIHNGPFSGIIIPQNKETDAYLKKLENASHTRLEYDSISNQNESKIAKKFLKNLENSIIDYISDSLKVEESEIEELDTSDMIFSVENILSKNIMPLSNYKEIYNGNGEELNLSDSKIGTEDHELEISDSRGINKEGFITSNTFKSTKKNNARNIKQKKLHLNKQSNKKPNKFSTNNLFENDENYSVSSVLTSSIKRVQLKDKEYIMILASREIGDDIKKANVYFSRIDGDGEKEKEIFELNQNFVNIFDKNNEKKLSFKRNKISDVSILNGKIMIELFYNDKYNKDCKFNLNLEYKL